MPIDGQPHKEEIAEEQAHFDKYFRGIRDRDAARGHVLRRTAWEEKATHPRSRPLDYWEYSFYLLGDLRGKKVLDVGCGGGWITRLLARAGASVSACDVSIEGCLLTHERLKASGSDGSSIAVMDAHAIGFRDAMFDAILITGVLHHVNIEKVSRELHRLLKPGGKVVFYEPLNYGPIMWAIRKLWLRLNGIKEYEMTEHEENLTESDLTPFKQTFARSHIRKFNFIAKTNRLRNRFGRLAVSLRWIDYFILSVFPFFRRYCTCIVCCFEK